MKTSTVQKRNAQDTSDPKNWRPKIVQGASKCFRKFSVQKTTIDDITKEVGISRPTFYRFFSDKMDLLLYIANQEVSRLVTNIEDLQGSIDSIDELFTEAIFQIVVDCKSSDVVKFLLSPENEDLSVALTDADNETWLLFLEGWQPLLELAEREGRLRPGAEFKDITRWITAVQTLMVTRDRALQLPDESLREWIVRYVVPSVLRDK